MADRSVNIALGGRAWTIERARLGGFLRLQQARESLNKGIKDGGNGQIVGGIFEFLSVALPDLKPKDFHSAPWYEVFNAHIAVEALNQVPHGTEFAILHTSELGGKPVPWDNPLRAIIIWIHLIAKTYAWAKSEIEELWPEEAIAFVQEIMADEQTDREFIYSLSDMAYEYNKTTKKSHFRPLSRPMWMMASEKKKDIITKLRKDMMPIGRIVYPRGVDEDLLPHE
jgi:hypothetical protein